LLASINGEDVSKLRQDLTAKMTPVQIAEAQKLAKEFAAKNNNAKSGGPIIEPNSSEGVNKDATRIERLSKQIWDTNNDIELNERRIESLPPIPLRYLCAHAYGTSGKATTIRTRTVEDTSTSQRTTPGSSETTTHRESATITQIYEEHIYIQGKHCDYRLHRDEVPDIQEALKTSKKAWQLLADQEDNYRKIIRFAERNSDLGINVMDMKKELIECQGRKKIAELVKECLRAVILNNRDMFNITPK
jgi:hypothetical protein